MRVKAGTKYAPDPDEVQISIDYSSVKEFPAHDKFGTELHKNPKSARGAARCAAYAARRRGDLKSEDLDFKEKYRFSELFMADIA